MYNVDCILIKDIKNGLKNINVVFIVLDIGSATVTKENREVRNFKVGDISACINVSIWDEPGKLIAPGDIIRLTKGYASIWRHCLTLYSGKNGEVCKIGEFTMTFNEQVNLSEPKRPDQQIPNVAGVAAVPSIQIGAAIAPPIIPAIVGAAQVQPIGGNGSSTAVGGAQRPLTLGNVVGGAAKAAVAGASKGASAAGGVAGVQAPQAGSKPSRGGRSNVTRASNLKADRR